MRQDDASRLATGSRDEEHDEMDRRTGLAPAVAAMGINCPPPHFGGGPVALGLTNPGAWWIAPVNLRTIEAIGQRTGATHPGEAELLSPARRRAYETGERGPLNEKVQVSGTVTGSKIDLRCGRGHVAKLRRTTLEAIAEEARQVSQKVAFVPMNNRPR
jgi:hypothetical protein